MGDENQRAGLSESRAVLSGGTRVCRRDERERERGIILSALPLMKNFFPRWKCTSDNCNQYACKRRALHDIN
jgi:hypothetical protein